MARRLLTLLTLIALSFAGCVTQTEAPGAVTPASVARDLPTELIAPALAPLAFLGMGSGEPNIVAAPDGTVYVAAINDIYRSDDAGATYELTMADLDGGGDGDIVVDPSGGVHWLGLFGDAGPIPYIASFDRGATWTDSLDISNETGSDREWLASRPDEPTIYAAWRDGDEGGIVAFRSSFDAGKSWNPRVTISPDAVGGPIVAGPVPGQVYQAQAVFESGTGAMDASIRLARSADHGATWELLPIVTPTQGPQAGLVGFPFSIFPVVAADDAGTLYVVYAVDQGMLPGGFKPTARFGVYLITSADEGDTWSAPRLLSAPEHAAVMPFVVAGAKGRIAAVWYENTYGVPHDNLPDVWNVKLLEMIDADTEEPQTQLVQLNDAPNHIGAICTSGLGCLATAGDRSLLDFFEVAIMPNGHPVVTWAATDYPQQGTLGIATQLATGEGRVGILARAVVDGTPLR